MKPTKPHKFMTLEHLDKIDQCRHLLPEPAPEVVGELVNDLRRYVKAMDAICNHNEAARAAVIKHFGISHQPSPPASDPTNQFNAPVQHVMQSQQMGAPGVETPRTDALGKKLFPDTWEYSYWKMKDLARELERELAEVTKQRDRLAKWIVNNPPKHGGDHACSECYPHSDCIVDGFVCGFHAATALAAVRGVTP